MSRKDYVMIARVIREQYDLAAAEMESAKQDALESLTHELAREFKADNGRFDRSKFIVAALG